MWYSWERSEKHTRFWWESPKERPLGRQRRRWEDGIRMDLREGVGVEWIQLAQDRDWWGYTEDGDEPSGSGATEVVTSFLRSAQKHT
jgi:hypothetical protein